MVTAAATGRRPLPRGLILGVLQRAGCRVQDDGRDKIPICCPLPGHDDVRPSAFVNVVTNVLYCSAGCTGGRAWTTKALSEALGVPWPPPELRNRRVRTRGTSRPFGPADAATLWQAALRRALDDAYAEADRAAYEYLERRGLCAAWEHRAFGLVTEEMDVHPAARRWVPGGYRIAAPLFDVGTGEITNVQARCIIPNDPKVLVPKGSKMAGTAFANEAARALIRDPSGASGFVIVGEGLTDFLAFTISLGDATPIVCAPGAGGAPKAIGPWIRGLDLVVATDNDTAGAAVVQRVADEASRLGSRRTLRLSWPGGAKDACEMVEKYGAEGLHDAIRSRLPESRPRERSA